MAIAEHKRRITLSIDKEIVDKIENLAKDDKRTLSNEISFILEEYLKNKEGNK